MRQPSRKIEGSDSILHRLNCYAAAASAAGVGALALTIPAQAEIVYTPAHQKILPNTSLNIDLNHDGIVDFIISDTLNLRSTLTNSGFYSYAGSLTIRSGGGCKHRQCNNAAEGPIAWPHSAFPLPFGARVGPEKNFSDNVLVNKCECDGGYGFWSNRTNRYVGLKFMINGEAHFGWARLTTRQIGFTKFVALLTGYAYETVPDTPIIAGATTGPASDSEENNPGPGASITNPQPPRSASLGALALGAQGLSSWRRTIPLNQGASKPRPLAGASGLSSG